MRHSLPSRLTSLFAKAGRRGFWPAADQGVVSLGNFLTVLLLGRGLVKADYGTFTVVMEAMFFLLSLHSGVVSYPLTVLGAVADDRKLRHLATASLLFTVLLAVPVTLVSLVVARFYHLLALGLIAVVALTVWQMQEAIRRGLMSHFRHNQAIWGDAVSYLGQAASLLVLYRLGQLTLTRAFASLVLAQALGLVIQVMQVGLSTVRRDELLEVARRFWRTGRWVLLTNLSGVSLMVCGNWALGWSHGPKEIANFAAIAVLLKVANPIMQTVSGLIVPASAKSLAEGGMAAARRMAFKMSAVGALALAPIFLVLLVFPQWCLWTAFHGKFSGPQFDFALRLIVLNNAVIFLTLVTSSFFNGVHHARLAFYGQLAGSIAMFAVLLPMNIAYGWMGYVVGGLLQGAVQLAVLLLLLRKLR